MLRGGYGQVAAVRGHEETADKHPEEALAEQAPQRGEEATDIFCSHEEIAAQQPPPRISEEIATGPAHSTLPSSRTLSTSVLSSTP